MNDEPDRVCCRTKQGCFPSRCVVDVAVGYDSCGFRDALDFERFRLAHLAFNLLIVYLVEENRRRRGRGEGSERGAVRMTFSVWIRRMPHGTSSASSAVFVRTFKNVFWVLSARCLGGAMWLVTAHNRVW